MKRQSERVPYEQVLNLFLLDTSGSMRRKTKNHQGQEKRKIDQLNEGLTFFTNEVGEDDDTRERVAVSLVSFGGGVTVEQDFQPIKSSWLEDGPPTLSAGGSTPMCEAIVKGLNNLESYVVETGLSQEQAFVWLLTDGRPDNNSGSKWEKVKRNIAYGSAHDDFHFYAAGIGDEADMGTLRDLLAGVNDEDKTVFNLDENQSLEFFMRAYESAKQKSKPADFSSFDLINSAHGSGSGQSEGDDIVDEDDFEGRKVRVGDTLVSVGQKIGSGSQGAVYRLAGNDNSILKIFNDQTRDKKVVKVRTMIDNEPKDSTYAHQGDWSIIWPQAVVEDPNSGVFLGYEMPYKDLNTAKNAFEYAMTELDWQSSKEEHRYRVASNLAILVAAIHNEGHAIGDFHHDNILIYEDGSVTLIDCDTLHITDDNTAYPDETYYPRYAPPERRGGTSLTAVQEADWFGLGVHIFQFLMEGFHPYFAQGPESVDGSMEDSIEGNRFPYDAEKTGIRPPPAAPDYEQLPVDIRQLFSESFRHTPEKSNWDSPNRPCPIDWIEVFDDHL
ncbi:protein kinase domain-containing protein [Haloarcula amylovorans]|uniref:protein kinase domain-containing protein n=1 Tax=Haloarcula amylovorans TaxID=2562280 RepID=UPI0010764B7F|nr:VWA domain-containing protein [Halomicroarcula amylolytica]